MTTYLLDCDFYCENCTPDGAELCADGGGESDCPQHCAHCGQPLENPLTSQGVEYVMNEIVMSLEDALDHGKKATWDRIIPLTGTAEETMTYYHGSRHVEILRGGVLIWIWMGFCGSKIGFDTWNGGVR